jgi:phage terminase small subunit
MRIRQMGFSSRLKAHRHLLTLETLRFIVEFLQDGNARQAALRSGIPETYAARQGAWLKKLPIVKKAFETEIDSGDLRKLQRALGEIDQQIEICREILGLNELGEDT